MFEFAWELFAMVMKVRHWHKQTIAQGSCFLHSLYKYRYDAGGPVKRQERCPEEPHPSEDDFHSCRGVISTMCFSVPFCKFLLGSGTCVNSFAFRQILPFVFCWHCSPDINEKEASHTSAESASSWNRPNLVQNWTFCVWGLCLWSNSAGFVFSLASGEDHRCLTHATFLSVIQCALFVFADASQIPSFPRAQMICRWEEKKEKKHWGYTDYGCTWFQWSCVLICGSVLCEICLRRLLVSQHNEKSFWTMLNSFHQGGIKIPLIQCTDIT